MCQQNCPVGRTAPCYQPNDPGFQPEVIRLIEEYHSFQQNYIDAGCFRKYRGKLSTYLGKSNENVPWKIDRAVVLALGNLDGEANDNREIRSDGNSSMWQLVCFLETFRLLQHWGHIHPGVQIYAHDPVFTPVDLEVLNRLNINAFSNHGPSAGMPGPGAFVWAAGHPDENDLFVRLAPQYYPYDAREPPSVYVGSEYKHWVHYLSGNILNHAGTAVVSTRTTSQEEKDDLNRLKQVVKHYGRIHICDGDCELHDEGINLDRRLEYPLDFTVYQRKPEVKRVSKTMPKRPVLGPTKKPGPKGGPPAHSRGTRDIILGGF